MKKFVGILGAAHAGTNLIGAAIGNRPDAYFAGELCNLQIQGTWWQHLDQTCLCQQRPCPLWSQVKDLRADAVIDKITEIMGCDILVESSKNSQNYYAQQLPNIYGKFDPRFVFVYKDDLLQSYASWKRTSSHLMSWMGSYIGCAGFLNSARVPFIAINLSEFLNKPAAHLEYLSEWLEIPSVKYEPDLLSKGIENTHFISGSGTLSQRLFRGNGILEAKAIPSSWLLQYRHIVEGIIKKDLNFEKIREKIVANTITV